MHLRRSVQYTLLMMLIGVVSAALAGAMLTLRDNYNRYRMKVTVTHMVQVGRICLATKPRWGDCKKIVRGAGVDLDLTTCIDGWGHPIEITVTPDDTGVMRYVLSARGPYEGGAKAFVWSDGEWRTLMPGTPP
jgi:hypothetical protein